MTRPSEQMDFDRRAVLLLGLAGASALAMGTGNRVWAGEATESPGVSMVVAAQAFLNTLSPELRTQVTFPFEGEDRFRWHYLPQEMFPRKGVNIKEMTVAQRKAAHTLLRSALSTQGYLKTTHIMQHERILGADRASDGDRAVPARSGAVLVDALWRAVPREAVGVARGRASPVPKFLCGDA